MVGRRWAGGEVVGSGLVGRWYVGGGQAVGWWAGRQAVVIEMYIHTYVRTQDCLVCSTGHTWFLSSHH